MIEYIFFYKDILVGGCELLIEKVSKQIIREGFPVKILCRSIDESMFKRFNQSEVEICQLRDWDSNKELLDHISLDYEVRMITFFWEDFVRVYRLKKRRMKTILYAVHFQVLAIGSNCRFPLLKKVLKAVGARSIYKLLTSKKILCMDEQTVRYTQNYFKDKLLNDTSIYKIVRVPVNIIDVNKDQMRKRAGTPDFNVLAIARADFPFKGYLLGLIDFIKEIKDKNNLHLDIISYGKDIGKLKNKIKTLDTESKKVITLHGKTDYDGLDRYYDRAKLYVGMGTTILDAAQRGVICVPVVPYTEEVEADKFFHEDYRVLAAEGETSSHIVNLWETAKGLSSEKYLELSEKSRNSVIENYGIEKITPMILCNFNEINEDWFDAKIFIFRLIGIMQYMLYRSCGKKLRR